MNTTKTVWRPPYWADYCQHVRSADYAARVRVLENEGATTSDAQSVADLEFRERWFLQHDDAAKTSR